MQRPRVLLLGPELTAVSGVSTHLDTLLRSTLAHDADLVHFRVGSEGRDEARLAALARLAVGPLLLFRAIGRSDTDIVHVNTSLNRAFWRDCSFVAVARLRRRRVLLQVHGGKLPEEFARRSRLTRRVLLAVLGAADAVVVLAEVERRAYETFRPGLRLQVVPNAIPVRPPAVRADLRDGHDLRLLYVGRLVREKGLLEVVEAVALLRDRGIRVTFSLAGSGPDEAAVRARVADLDLGDRVALVGPVFGDDKQRLWQQADVFAFPTYHDEGLPYALLEAMAAEALPVTCDVGAIPDVLRDREHGLLVPPRDAVAGADAVAWVHEHRTEAARMSADAAARVRSDYTVERLASDFRALYEGLVRGDST